MTDGPYFAGDESGGGGGGAPPSSSEIGAALGFITEFNHNVAIFNAVAALIIQNSLASFALTEAATRNTHAIRTNSRDIDTLRAAIAGLARLTDNRGYSVDNPRGGQDDGHFGY